MRARTAASAAASSGARSSVAGTDMPNAMPPRPASATHALTSSKMSPSPRSAIWSRSHAAERSTPARRLASSVARRARMSTSRRAASITENTASQRSSGSVAIALRSAASASFARAPRDASSGDRIMPNAIEPWWVKAAHACASASTSDSAASRICALNHSAVLSGGGEETPPFLSQPKMPIGDGYITVPRMRGS